MNKRPISVTIIACVYIAVGAIGFVYHFLDVSGSHTPQSEVIAIEAVRVLAIICGIFMFHAQNWARWVALGWIGFHVILSAFHGVAEFAIHSVFCAIIAWCLFHREAGEYFKAKEVEEGV